MRQVWKFSINGGPIHGPGLGKVVHFGLDPVGDVCIWAEVDESKERTTKDVVVVGTGHRIPVDFSHVGSCLDGAFMWHLYERKP